MARIELECALQARFRVPPGRALIEVPSLALQASAVAPPLAPLPLHLEAAARWDPAAQKLTLPRATVRSADGLGTLAFDGPWQRSGGGGTGPERLPCASRRLGVGLPLPEEWALSSASTASAVDSVAEASVSAELRRRNLTPQG